MASTSEKIGIVHDALEKQLQREYPAGRVISFVASYHWQNLDDSIEGDGSFVGAIRSGTLHDALGLMELTRHDYKSEFESPD